MDQILSGLTGVQCYLDDLLITGKDETEHLSNLEATLQRLQSFGLRVRKDKCEFFCPSVEYLGHVIDSSGLHKAPSKVKAIVEAPAPQNVSQLRSFLGLLTYYAKFVPNLANRLKQLHELLNKSKKWEWSKQCEESFNEVKTALAQSEALTHFNPALPVQLACDASPYGVGAVVSHIMPSGEEKPIAFASRTLSKAECNYAQIEREALAIVFGVKKFHQFLFGRRFTLLTDHRPLTSIFGPHSGIPSLAAARMQRWTLLLSAHQYDIKYRRSEHHANADGLSRLPLPTTHPEPAKAEIFYFKEVDNSLVTAAQVKKHTRTDPVMSKVLDLVLRGEVGEMSPFLRPYVIRRNELTVESGCLLWGSRVIIPPPLRQRVLEELHSGHCGVVRMKEIARSYLWWPSVDSEIEEKAKMCSACQKLRNTPQPAPLHPWQWPEELWVRVHIDFAGPLEDHMFFVLLDAHSKWPEVEVMKCTSSMKTVEALRSIFGRFGLPQQLVSDNGPQLVSEEFEAFMKANGIQHIRSAPYHPSTNGLAEWFVQTMKQALKSTQGKGSLNQRLNTFLLSYRNTPHAITKVSPAAAMFKRQLRTRLDLLKPLKTKQTVQAQQHLQMERRLKAKHRCFRPGDKVLARNYGKGVKWLPAVVIAQTGPVSYTVELADGHIIWKRHVDQLLAANSCDNSGEQVTIDPYLEIASEYHDLPENSSTPTLENAQTETLPSQVKETVPDHSYYLSILEKYQHLKNITLQSFEGICPLLLIVADINHLITPISPVRLGPSGGLAAFQTRLRWTLQGPQVTLSKEDQESLGGQGYLDREHAQSALEGAGCEHCDALPMRTLRSRLALFNQDRVPQGSGPAAAEARRRSQTWSSQMDLSVDVETGSALSQPLSEKKELGLWLNAKKSVLSPLQRTTFLGVVWDSVSMQARLSPPRVDSILAAVKSVKLGQLLTVKQFQRLLGLMAAASNVIPFGLLHMRPLQWWLRNRGFSPRGNPFRTIKVTRRCLRALVMWKKPWFLSQGPVLGAPCRRKLLTTEASLTGWGAILEGRSSQGLWEDHHRSWHINRLEMLAVFRALRSFITDLRGHHVLVHTDNTSVVAYINHQGGLRSRPLSNLARHILLWSQGKLLSLRAA
ncbi:hypothetical protein PO909_015169 [Leuciscus waleckii]